MTRLKDLDIAELASYVQQKLRKRGIETVLTGGAAVGVHGASAYISKDIDLVCIDLSTHQQIRDAMLELGFEEKNRFSKGLKFA